MSTINRGPFNALVDDDGSGTTGTIWNKAAIQSVILDPADAAYGGVVQTTTLTGTQNNFALTPNCRILRCNNTALLTLTGFTAGYDGQLLTIEAINAGQVDLLSNNAGSGAKLLNWVASGPTSLSPVSAGPGMGGSATYLFEAGAYWRLIAHEQGAWITPAYSAANFTASGSMIWTVDAGDVTTYAYTLSGRRLSINFALDGTSVGGTLSTDLLIKIPNGYICTRQTNIPFYSAENGPSSFGLLQINASGVAIRLLKQNFAAWSATTNTTTVYGSVMCEVQ